MMEPIKFRDQSFQLALFSLFSLIIIAFIHSMVYGHYWSWVAPFFNLLLLPRTRKQSWVVIDDAGVEIGGENKLEWINVASLAKKGRIRAVFQMKDGTRKSLDMLSWSRENRKQFYTFLEGKGL